MTTPERREEEITTPCGPSSEPGSGVEAKEAGESHEEETSGPSPTEDSRNGNKEPPNELNGSEEEPLTLELSPPAARRESEAAGAANASPHAEKETEANVESLLREKEPDIAMQEVEEPSLSGERLSEAQEPLQTPADNDVEMLEDVPSDKLPSPQEPPSKSPEASPGSPPPPPPPPSLPLDSPVATAPSSGSPRPEEEEEITEVERQEEGGEHETRETPSENLQGMNLEGENVEQEEEEENVPMEEDDDDTSGIIKISAVASLSSTDLLSPEDIAEASVPLLEETSKDGDASLPEEAAGDVNGSSLSSSPRSNAGSNSSGAPPPVKKVGLKLASFAGLGHNGIADTTPVTGHGKVSGCKQCFKEINMDIDQLLIWETMQFCRETCLRNYQNDFNKCSSCKKTVTTTSVGKYCVRFGSDIKQFCSNVCLEAYKKGLKVCCYCQKDISGGDGFLAPIGDKGQFKDFCLQTCLKRYEALHLGKVLEKEIVPCAVCSDLKPVELELLVKDEPRVGSSSSLTTSESKTKIVKLCSNPCFSAFKFANSLDTSKCDFCSMPYDIHVSENVIYFGNFCKRFCTISCQNVYVMKYRKIVSCQWCKVKKYNFDMVEKPNRKGGSPLVYCSVNCLNLHSFTRKGPDNTSTSSQHPPSWNGGRGGSQSKGSMPVIQSVSSLAGASESPSMFPPPEAIPPPDFVPAPSSGSAGVKEVIKEYIVKCPEDVQVRNKATLTKPYMQTKGVSCRPNTSSKFTQTESSRPNCLLPVSVPFYLPVPLRMYSAPYPVPVPVPIPIPVPVFMPIKRNSMEGVMKAIQKLHSKLPSDPFEAELLAMAGAIADKASLLDSDSEDDILLGQEAKSSKKEEGKETQNSKSNSPTQKTNVTTSIPDQVEDLEKEIIADKVVPKPLPPPTVDPSQSLSSQNNNYSIPSAGRTRSGLKRRTSFEPEPPSTAKESAPPKPKTKAPRGRPPKIKQSRVDTSSAASTRSNTPTFPTAPKERPDSKHHLKFTYGVNAWKHWVIKKNAEFEKGQSEGKYLKSFETDLLKLRADELNYTLCMFVKEVKKPNGDSYAPDSVLYLTLGIQEYLFENGRIDNIFTDIYYETFTSTLHEVVKDFKLPVNELGYFVTRIEEEHLWESKQLGCHTPQVLLNTLIYLNTKYFMLKTCDEHAKLSFTQIMKHWKKTMTPGKTNQERTVLLRYHPPVTNKGKGEDKKCYEQHENTENPARCPVKYYEQYTAKCPESAKSRQDVFYLQPERSCVADSPLWFSNEQLSTHQLDKMLQRLLMVREIQEHMLADASNSS